MKNVIVTDDEVEAFFSKADGATLVYFLNQLLAALQTYTVDPSINPPRMAHKIISKDGDEVTHLIMPVVSQEYSGVKTLVNNPILGLQGSITVMDPIDGTLKGSLEAKVITAVRTALVSCLPLYLYLKDHLDAFKDSQFINLSVFGTGLQAKWHIIIAIKLLHYLYPSKPFHVTTIYRTRPINTKVLKELLGKDAVITLNDIQIDDKLGVRKCVGQSNVIFGCLPTLTPNLFCQDLNRDGSFTYISLIGSYRSTMHECDEELIDMFKNSSTPIIVDSCEHTLSEAGELISANVKKSNLVEIGELSASSIPVLEVDGNHFILCKIIGLAVMDIAVSQLLLKVLGE